DDVVRFNVSASVLRKFGRSDPLPRGLLPFGDAICRFNPVYGQGMSVAAQQACLLRRLLAAAAGQGTLEALPSAFLAEVSSLIETPWALTAIVAMTYPQSRGARPPYLESAQRFQVGLLRLAAEDPAVHKTMMEVQNLLKPRSVYSDPALAQRMRAALSGR